MQCCCCLIQDPLATTWRFPRLKPWPSQAHEKAEPWQVKQEGDSGSKRQRGRRHRACQPCSVRAWHPLVVCTSDGVGNAPVSEGLTLIARLHLTCLLVFKSSQLEVSSSSRLCGFCEGARGRKQDFKGKRLFFHTIPIHAYAPSKAGLLHHKRKEFCNNPSLAKSSPRWTYWPGTGGGVLSLGAKRRWPAGKGHPRPAGKGHPPPPGPGGAGPAKQARFFSLREGFAVVE